MGTAARSVVSRAPARRTEIVVKLIRGSLVRTWRTGSECNAHIEHVIVEGEVSDRHPIEGGLVLPVLAPQASGFV